LLGALVLGGKKGKARTVTSSTPSGPGKLSRADAHVLLLGDSLAVGLAPELAKLAKRDSVDFAAEPKGGTSVCQWVEDSWLLPPLKKHNANLLLLSLSANDYQRNDPEHVRASINELVRKAQGYGVRVRWIAPPRMPFRDPNDVRQMWVDALGSEPWFDGEELDIPRGPDHIHPTGPGYAAFALAVWSWLVPTDLELVAPSSPAKASEGAKTAAPATTAPPAPPAQKPPSGATPGALPGLPPMAGGGRAFVEALPKTATFDRDVFVLEAVKRRFIRPMQFKAVHLASSELGLEGWIWVSTDTICVGTATDFVRCSVSMLCAQLIADELGCLLPTTGISDLAWVQAELRIPHVTQIPDAHMADTSVLLKQHDAIEDLRGGDGLLRTVGKDYVITNELDGHPDRCAIYGWHDKAAGVKSPGGLPIVQGLNASTHEALYKDYSHLPTFVAGECVLGGKRYLTEQLYQSPKWSKLVSYEGPLRIWRHPAVAVPADWTQPSEPLPQV
jgi:lysophospholipase L1-like esterase